MFDIVEKRATACVEPPRHRDTAEIKSKEGVKRPFRTAGESNGGAKTFGNEEGAVGCDGRCETDDRSRFLV